MTEKIFTNGMSVKAPHQNAPDFVKANVSFKASEFIKFLEQYQNAEGWVNVDIKESKGGKWYSELNIYKRTDTPNVPAGTASSVKRVNDGFDYPTDEINPDDIPF